MPESKRVLFDATISKDGASYRTPAEIEFLPSGEVVPHFPEMPYTKAFQFIYNSWHAESDEFGRYVFSATSADGLRFYSNNLSFNSVGLPFRSGQSFACLKGFFDYAILERSIEDPRNWQIVRCHLQGFENYGMFEKQTSLGTVIVAGNLNYEDYQHVGGVISVERREEVLPPEMNWEADARAFLTRLHTLLNFARSNYHSIAYIHAFRANEIVTEYLNPLKTERPFLPPIHSLSSDAFFSAAIDACLTDKGILDKIRFGVDWMVNHQDYNELRLVVRMMALEHFIDGLLEGRENRRMEAAMFRELRRKLEEILDRELAADDPNLPSIKASLGNLNSRALKEKIRALVDKYDVPMHDISWDQVEAVVRARNDVVHRGLYYLPGEPERPELWGHVIVLNELLVRLVLRIVKFEGSYESWLGGMVSRRFPECAKAR